LEKKLMGKLDTSDAELPNADDEGYARVVEAALDALYGLFEPRTSPPPLPSSLPDLS
jgi:hypothetical protein